MNMRLRYIPLVENEAVRYSRANENYISRLAFIDIIVINESKASFFKIYKLIVIDYPSGNITARQKPRFHG
jgi:hypothetical protein